MSGFEIVALLLATPEAVRDIIAFGKGVGRVVRRLRNPNSLLEELQKFDLDSENRKLEIKIEIGRRIVNNTTHYEQVVRDALDSDFKAFQQALKDINGVVAKLLDHNVVAKALMESHYMRKLNAAVTELAMIRRRFMDTIDTIHVQDHLPSFAQLESKKFSIDLQSAVDVTNSIKKFRCQLTVAIRDVRPQAGEFLLELRKYNAKTKDTEQKRVKDAAETLSTARDNGHILSCIGFRDLPELDAFAIIFAFSPGTSSLKSVGSYIRAKNSPVPSLTVRIKLCKLLAAAVLQVHTLQPPMIHKNINLDNTMLLFQEGATLATVPDEPLMYLTNWHLSRNVSDATDWMAVSQWWHQIYQHPKRQFPRTEEVYSLDHDIYSLGVCMIEILLWKPLVEFDAANMPCTKGLLFPPNTAVPNISGDLRDWSGPDPGEVRKRLGYLAKVEILPIAGQLASGVIVKCLEGLGAPKDVLGAIFAQIIKEPLDTICV